MREIRTHSDLRKRIIVAIAFAIHVTIIFLLFPIFGTTVFAISMLPAAAAGWIYGRKWGLLIGLVSVGVTFVCQALMGVLTVAAVAPALFGGPLIVVAGAAFGHLRDLGQQSKHATQALFEAEAAKRKLERQLQQSQKLEAIGTLAGGVAHDMNNILGIIMSSLSVLRHDVKQQSCSEEDIENALRACRRGRDLTRNLLGFARKGAYVREGVNLNRVLDEVLRLIAPMLGKNIRIEIESADELMPILGDRGQIEQALLNICINSAEAVPDHGRILIRTWNGTEADRAMSAQYRLAEDNLVFVEISDNGHGMDATVSAHAFEPFFTTKQPGKGTGLGLAMVYGMMKKHNGAIDLISTPGEGTSITMIFPGAPELQVEERAAAVPASTCSSLENKGRILLVDDEPLIRASCRRMLVKLGYDVIPAENGETAVEIFEKNPSRFDAVILDLIMPGLNGAETFDKLRAVDPDVRVLISSGFSKDGTIEEVLNRGAAGFIQKPFEVEQIAALIAFPP